MYVTKMNENEIQILLMKCACDENEQTRNTYLLLLLMSNIFIPRNTKNGLSPEIYIFILETV